jgi:16S rRNA (guanine966-N2)-methyltransferase
MPITSTNQLRIIGGQWRGRKFSFTTTEGLRPTGDRIRETLFNWLQTDIAGASCLDLFSGSGALGLEALSRGAEAVTLLEKNSQAATQIKHHLEQLSDHNGKVINTDSLKFLSIPADQSYDIVFIDPPFQAELWDQIFMLLEKNWLNEHALIYVESPKQQKLNIPNTWQPHKQKQAGQVNYALYCREQ